MANAMLDARQEDGRYRARSSSTLARSYTLLFTFLFQFYPATVEILAGSLVE